MVEYRHPGDNVALCLQSLTHILDTIPSRLKEFSPAEFSLPQGEGKWSKKQIIGHLIDSATNNHQRFVRGQFEDKPAIGYDQEKWNDFSYYDQMDGHQVISFWEDYNRFLIALITRIPASLLTRECTMSDGSTCTIARLF